MLAAASERVPVRLEAVDGNGLVPVAEHGRAYPTARGYRGFVQKTLPGGTSRSFRPTKPLAELEEHAGAEVPAGIVPADGRRLGLETADARGAGRRLPTSTTDVPVAPARGGSTAAGNALATFLADRLPRYAQAANDPDEDCTSRLSPYLHFGHVGAHEVFASPS